MHAGERPALQVRGTLPALSALRAEGLIGEPTFAVLDEGYRFLRRLKGRIQIVHDRPSARLPRDPSELDKLARRMGYRDQAAGDLLRAHFLLARERIRGEVTTILPGMA
jgi:glutamate-ammonia-ligase adenylyltransferase